MKSVFSDFEVTTPRSAAYQVADRLRQAIMTGQLRPGDKLPPTRELARLWHTHLVAAHQGMAQLAKEGLVVRRPRVGTIVCPHEQRLTKVALYQSDDPSAQPQMRFLGAMDAALQSTTSRAHLEISLLLDRRPELEQAAPPPPLAAMIREHEVQAVIALNAADRHMAWLRQLPVPTTYLCNALDPRAVGFDMPQFARASVEALAHQGCRSFALIATIDPAETDKPTSDVHNLYQRFRDAAAAFGLQTRPEWWATPAAGVYLADADHEQFGYDQFQELWRKAERPDGLVVYPDGAARGVIAAVLERQVRVPDQLRLVLHRNAEIKLLCPVPASFLESAARCVAEALLGQLHRQLRSQPCEQVSLPFRLVPAGASSAPEPIAQQDRPTTHKGVTR